MLNEYEKGTKKYFLAPFLVCKIKYFRIFYCGLAAVIVKSFSTVLDCPCWSTTLI